VPISCHPALSVKASGALFWGLVPVSYQSSCTFTMKQAPAFSEGIVWEGHWGWQEKVQVGQKGFGEGKRLSLSRSSLGGWGGHHSLSPEFFFSCFFHSYYLHLVEAFITLCLNTHKSLQLNGLLCSDYLRSHSVILLLGKL
jgi:hypothetical protein